MGRRPTTCSFDGFSNESNFGFTLFRHLQPSVQFLLCLFESLGDQSRALDFGPQVFQGVGEGLFAVWQTGYVCSASEIEGSVPWEDGLEFGRDVEWVAQRVCCKFIKGLVDVTLKESLEGVKALRRQL